MAMAMANGAPKRGRRRMVRGLGEEGEEREEREERARLLVDAARLGRVDAVWTLLEEGVPPDSSVEGRTALMLACRRGHYDVVDLLLQNGASVNEVEPIYGEVSQCWFVSQPVLFAMCTQSVFK